MNAQFQVVRQAKFFDRIIDNEYIFLKLTFELRHISYIINTFIETTCKFWGYCLNRNALLRNHFQDKEHFNRGLWRFNLIHRNLGNKSTCALLIFYVIVYPTSFGNCCETLWIAFRIANLRQSAHSG